MRPRWVLSFHQPLDGVDIDTKRPEFARRLARALRLPTTTLDCGGVCHGTMTELVQRTASPAPRSPSSTAPSPPRHRMAVEAPRQLLGVLGARRTR